MSWSHWLTDATTGLLIRPISIPSFRAKQTVGDFGFTTVKKNLGKAEASGLTVPFSQFDTLRPGCVDVYEQASQSEIASLLSMGRRGLLSCWRYEGCPDERGIPLFWGVLGEAEDSWRDTTFPVYSIPSILSSRFAVRDGQYKDGHSTDTVSYTGLSYRGLASELGSLVTERKNGGTLPVDWTYKGEKGKHERTEYKAWNVQNLMCRQLQENLTNVQDGPDMTYRPYFSDAQHVRNRFLAASDADVYLDADHEPFVLTAHPHGGTLSDFKVSYALPVQRIYATGAGNDQAIVTALAEDLEQISRSADPPILRESVMSDTDITDVQRLKAAAQGMLDANRRPLMQFTGKINANDIRPDGLPIMPFGGFWPGEMFHIDLKGHRRLPDARYDTRLMQVDYDQSANATLTFDVMESPV
jgi:hypothetical protein